MVCGGHGLCSPCLQHPPCPSREEMAFPYQPFSAELGKASLAPRASGSQHRTHPKGGNCRERPDPQVVPSGSSGKLPNPKVPIPALSSESPAALTRRGAPCARGCPLSSGTSWHSAGKARGDAVIGNPWGWLWEWGTPLGAPRVWGQLLGYRVHRAKPLRMEQAPADAVKPRGGRPELRSAE